MLPGCRSGYKGEDMTGINIFGIREEWRGKIPPLEIGKFQTT